MDKGKKRKNKRKLITRGHGNEPTVIEFNLSKAVILCIAIGVVIATITTVTVITTIIEAKQNTTLAETESNEKVTYVESTTIGEDGTVTVDKDEDGETITVPVPKGYSASKIPGETSANHGFVIYEGDVDWDSILVGEDGPTHQPIEQLANLRNTPNVLVFRPCDTRETVVGYLLYLLNDNKPTALILSR